VQQDRREDQHRLGGDLRVEALGEQEVPRDPREDADDNRPLVPEPLEHDRQQEQEHDVRHLREGHPAGEVGPFQLAEIDAHVDEVEVDGDADQEQARDADGERWLAEQRERVEAEDLADRHVAADLLGRRVRQREREDPEDDGDDACQVKHDHDF